MAQNPEKYYYINRVGLIRGSWAHKKFEADAAKHHMEDQPGKLVALRLTEYYELLERMGGAWTVPGTLVGAAVPMNGANGKLSLPEHSQVTVTEEEEEDSKPTKEPDDPDAALDDSIDYWTNL
jgi:hypothetical protein